MSGALDPFWGATLFGVEFDVIRQAITLTIRVTHGQQIDAHVLQCLDVTQLSFHNSIPGPWSYAELSEVRTEMLVSGSLRIEIMLWSEDSGMVIVCGRAMLDGDMIFN